jgi:hypothetical protein
MLRREKETCDIKTSERIFNFLHQICNMPYEACDRDIAHSCVTSVIKLFYA